MAVVYAVGMKRGVPTELGFDGERDESGQVREPTFQRSQQLVCSSTTATALPPPPGVAVPPPSALSRAFGLRTTGITGLSKHQTFSASAMEARSCAGARTTTELRVLDDAPQDAQRLR